MHPRGYVHGELEQLLGGEGGGGAVLLGEGRVGLQHSALPQEVQKVSVRGVFDCYVQVAYKRNPGSAGDKGVFLIIYVCRA